MIAIILLALLILAISFRQVFRKDYNWKNSDKELPPYVKDGEDYGYLIRGYVPPSWKKKG